MKKNLLAVSAGLILMLLIFFMVLHLRIGASVRRNINTAQEKYPGTPEEALIAYLLDKSNSFEDRTHVACWSLGQIGSEKALPILKGYYKDDPEGNTCYGKHGSMLCQYELYKAIRSIENKLE